MRRPSPLTPHRPSMPVAIFTEALILPSSPRYVYGAAWLISCPDILLGQARKGCFCLQAPCDCSSPSANPRQSSDQMSQRTLCQAQSLRGEQMKEGNFLACHLCLSLSPGRQDWFGNLIISLPQFFQDMSCMPGQPRDRGHTMNEVDKVPAHRGLLVR